MTPGRVTLFDIAATFTGVPTQTLLSITLAYLPEGSLTLLPSYIENLAARKGVSVTFESSSVTIIAEKAKESIKKVSEIPQEVLNQASGVALKIAKKFASCTAPSTWTLLSWSGEVGNEAEEININRIGKGIFSAFLKFSGESTKYLWLKLQVSCMKPVLVVKKLVRYGEKIRPQDVETKIIDVLTLYETPASSEDAIYAPAVKTLRPGDIVTLSSIKRKPDVVKGQVIIAYVTLPGIHISALVEALEDGYIGDTIRVRNISSGKILKGVLEKGPVLKILEVER